MKQDKKIIISDELFVPNIDNEYVSDKYDNVLDDIELDFEELDALYSNIINPIENYDLVDGINQYLTEGKVNILDDLLRYYENNKCTFCNPRYFLDLLQNTNSFANFCDALHIDQYPIKFSDKDDFLTNVWVERDSFEDIIKRLYSIFKEKLFFMFRQNRAKYRIAINEKVDFDRCSEVTNRYGLVFFKLYEAWGVANQNGVVLISNHIKNYPQDYYYYPSTTINYFVISQDIDTDLFGVIAVKKGKEIVPFQFNNIKLENKKDSDDTKCIFLVNTNLGIEERWGAYNSEGVEIVPVRYEYIRFRDPYIEAGRDGYLTYIEGDPGKYLDFYEGFFDLYDYYGLLLLGGYNHYSPCYKNVNVFYFGNKTKEVFVLT